MAKETVQMCMSAKGFGSNAGNTALRPMDIGRQSYELNAGQERDGFDTSGRNLTSRNMTPANLQPMNAGSNPRSEISLPDVFSSAGSQADYHPRRASSIISRSTGAQSEFTSPLFGPRHDSYASNNHPFNASPNNPFAVTGMDMSSIEPLILPSPLAAQAQLLAEFQQQAEAHRVPSFALPPPRHPQGGSSNSNINNNNAKNNHHTGRNDGDNAHLYDFPLTDLPLQGMNLDFLQPPQGGTNNAMMTLGGAASGDGQELESGSEVGTAWDKLFTHDFSLGQQVDLFPGYFFG